MNCDEMQSKLNRYAEQELADDEITAVEDHLHACLSCRQRAANLRQMTAVLYQLPVEEPPAGLEVRIMAAVSAVPAQDGVVQTWLYRAAIGLAAFFSLLMLLALGYQTLLVWQQDGTGQFISLLAGNPDLALRYPTEALYAVLESLPVVEIALTLGISLVIVLLLEQFLASLGQQGSSQFNGNHAGRGVA